jgi:hypothetical protein
MTLTLESPCDQNSLKESNFATISELILCSDQHFSKVVSCKDTKLNQPDTWQNPKRENYFKKKTKE